MHTFLCNVALTIHSVREYSVTQACMVSVLPTVALEQGMGYNGVIIWEERTCMLTDV